MPAWWSAHYQFPRSPQAWRCLPQARLGGTESVRKEPPQCWIKGATPMLDKKRRRFFFTDRQMQQLVRTNDRLRQSNGSALRELRRVGRSNLSSKKYKEAGI